jgi:hypothetical protein
LARNLQPIVQGLPLVRVQIAFDHFVQRVEGAVQLIARLIAPRPAHHQQHQHQDHEEAVDDGRGRREKVIVFLRDELAHFVDEQPDAQPAQHGGEQQRPIVDQDQRQDGGNDQQQPAPQCVRDVQHAVAHLRVSGEVQEQARQDHRRRKRGDRDDQIRLSPRAFDGPAHRSVRFAFSRLAQSRGSHFFILHRLPLSLESVPVNRGAREQRCRVLGRSEHITLSATAHRQQS